MIESNGFLFTVQQRLFSFSEKMRGKRKEEKKSLGTEKGRKMPSYRLLSSISSPPPSSSLFLNPLFSLLFTFFVLF